jgi:hypothetical protein
MVRDYVEVRDAGSLDALIERLIAIRDGLPEGTEPEVRLRGDDHFGRHIAIAFKRPLTAAEAECEGRYVDAGKPDAMRAAA